MKCKTQEEIKEWFKSRGSELCSEYKGWNKPLIFKCLSCGLPKEFSSFNNISNSKYGLLCHECIQQKISEEIKERLKQKIIEFLQPFGAELISPFPQHDKDKVHFLCANCKQPAEINCWHGFKRQKQKGFCKKCQHAILAEERKTPEEEIKQYFLNNNSELLSTFKNIHSVIQFKCSLCGQTEEACNFYTLQTRNPNCLCKKCHRKEASVAITTPREEIEKWFRERNSELIEYTDTQSLLTFKCSKCGVVSPYHSLHSLKKYNPLCKCKDCNKRVGELHHNWNKDLTEEERNNKRIFPGYQQWCQEVLRQAKYICVFSGETNSISPHHIYNYADFKEFRHFLWNGICLSDQIHIQFHKEYGFGKNTFLQLKKFCKEHFNLHIFLFDSPTLRIEVVETEKERNSQLSANLIKTVVLLEKEIIQNPEMVEQIIKNQVLSL